jgi:hypothetical protein
MTTFISFCATLKVKFSLVNIFIICEMIYCWRNYSVFHERIEEIVSTAPAAPKR